MMTFTKTQAFLCMLELNCSSFYHCVAYLTFARLFLLSSFEYVFV